MNGRFETSNVQYPFRNWLDYTLERIGMLYLLCIPSWLAPAFPLNTADGKGIILNNFSVPTARLPDKVVAAPLQQRRTTGDNVEMQARVVTVATHNVMTLRRQGAWVTLATQIAARKWFLTGLQEPRPYTSGKQVIKLNGMPAFVATFSAATAAGQYGCALLVCLMVPYASDGPAEMVVTPDMVAAVVTEPRLLITTITSEMMRLVVAVMHGPHSGDDQAEHYWHAAAQSLNKVAGAGAHVIALIDGNASLSSAELKKRHHAQHFRKAMHDAGLSEATQLSNDGERDRVLGTFRAVNGSWVQNDYIAIGGGVTTMVGSSTVVQGVTTEVDKADHLPVTDRVILKLRGSSNALARRRWGYERADILKVENASAIRAKLQQLQFLHRDVAAATHCHVMAQSFIDILCEVCPKRQQKAKVRNDITDATFARFRVAGALKTAAHRYARKLKRRILRRAFDTIRLDKFDFSCGDPNR